MPPRYLRLLLYLQAKFEGVEAFRSRQARGLNTTTQNSPPVPDFNNSIAEEVNGKITNARVKLLLMAGRLPSNGHLLVFASVNEHSASDNHDR